MRLLLQALKRGVRLVLGLGLGLRSGLGLKTDAICYGQDMMRKLRSLEHERSLMVMAMVMVAVMVTVAVRSDLELGLGTSLGILSAVCCANRNKTGWGSPAPVTGRAMVRVMVRVRVRDSVRSQAYRYP